MAKALYDFTTDQPGETSLRAGETIRLAPRHLQPRVNTASFALVIVIAFVLVIVLMVVLLKLLCLRILAFVQVKGWLLASSSAGQGEKTSSINKVQYSA